MALSGASLATPNLSKAEELYQHTDYEGSLALLDKKSFEPRAAFLMGRDYFMLGDFKKSTEYLQRATEAAPENAEYADWLGRAFGRRAETSNMILAPAFASKAREAFERSVQLDPKNSEALSDLFDYYLEAPGFLGGGFDKASRIADQVALIDPPEGFSEKSRLAQKRKEYQRAEEQLREAIAVAPRSVGQLIELAKFLANQGRTHESDAVFQQAERVAPNSPRVWFAEAKIYVKQNRNLDEARNLLEKYVHAPLTVDDPPKQEALRLLKQAGGV
jgi:cytochrome c-type biogenesis protein CcmH/NrfG